MLLNRIPQLDDEKTTQHSYFPRNKQSTQSPTVQFDNLNTVSQTLNKVDKKLTEISTVSPNLNKKMSYKSTVRPVAMNNPFVDLLNIDKFKGKQIFIKSKQEYISSKEAMTFTYWTNMIETFELK